MNDTTDAATLIRGLLNGGDTIEHSVEKTEGDITKIVQLFVYPETYCVFLRVKILDRVNKLIQEHIFDEIGEICKVLDEKKVVF